MENKEIKEILKNLKFNVYETKNWITPLSLNQENWITLLDYITNLQEYYNDNVNKYEDLLVKYSNLQEENERLLKKSYKDDVIITKAIEFIKEKQELTDIDEVIDTTKLLNILKGNDKE